MQIRPVLLLLWLPLAAAAQQQPMSAIDWLSEPASLPLPGTVLLEPPVTTTGLRPQIEVTPLEDLSIPVGLVGPDVTGLPVGIWRGSDIGRLERLIATVPVRDSPAMQALLFTLLLSETSAPSGSGAAERLLLARLDRLMALGAVDAAQELAQAAGPTDSAARFRRWFDATLLTGDEDRSCAALTAAPHLAPDYGARVFCTARRGDWASAALIFDTAQTLSILPADRADLLDRFLNPDLFEDADPPPAPSRPDPLEFRLREAIGERVPATALPLAFATADLRDIAGWKAQIEAAERLSRSGALTPNQLLGLYTARRPAASGGVWDRVAAMQRFETAMQASSPSALAKTLPRIWLAMSQARLEVPFAELFAERLAGMEFADAQSEVLAWHIRLLSQYYEDAALAPPDTQTETRFLAALAMGEPGKGPAGSQIFGAITDGFAPDAMPPREQADMIRRGQLGEAILHAMKLFASGASGDPGDLADALATFRSVGLEDTARRAALQLILLERG